jgi:alditol oxidase
MTTKITNWAGNYEFNARALHKPESLDELQQLVAQHDKIKVLGSRHSFNSIADTTENLVSFENLPPFISLDPDQQTVTVGPKVTYGMLSPVLHEAGFALHNLGSLPHISVIGACATATHGSGVSNKNLAAAVSAIEFIAANGEIVALSRDKDGDTFNGAVVNLGALGVVIRMTLDVLPTFSMRQTIYETLPLVQAVESFEKIMGGAYSVSLFTDWRGDNVNQVWLKQHLNEGESPTDFYGALAASHLLHPIVEMSPENCTYQLGTVGAWHERLPHFRIDAMPSAGNELQTEYFVASDQALAALQAINAIRDHISPHLLISEIRTIAADDMWMSTCYQRNSVAFHFTWKQDWPAVRQVLPTIESALAPFNARPHWGKLFTMPSAQIQRLYPRFADFCELIKRYDPHGKFRNAFLDEILV